MRNKFWLKIADASFMSMYDILVEPLTISQNGSVIDVWQFVNTPLESVHSTGIREAYSAPSGTSKMELFTLFSQKSSMLDVGWALNAPLNLDS